MTLDADIRALAGHLGAPVAQAEPVPWGDARSTYRVTLADERVVAAHILRGEGAVERASTLVARSRLLHEASMPVAHPAEAGTGGSDTAWVVTPWVDGPVGATLLDDDASTVRLAAAMGEQAQRLAAIDDAVPGADPDWERPDALAAAAHRWLATLGHGLDDARRARARHDLDTVLAAWDATPAWEIGLAHGDFVPINVVVAPDGGLVLLDLADVRRAPRLLDIAWWGWVVRYHHPAAWATAWTTFVTAAGLEPASGSDSAADAVARVRLLERAATAGSPGTRDAWLQRVDETTEW